MTRILVLAGALVLAGIGPAEAQTVQLPLFHYFTTSTTVLVPDQGSVLLGGVNRAAEGRVERGVPGVPGRPFTNVGISKTTEAANARVAVQIHDLETMDQALLSVPSTSAAVNPAVQFAVQKTNTIQARSAPVESIAALRAQAATEAEAQQAEARGYYEQGLLAYRDGKSGAAKVYWQMAERRASGELLLSVQAQLRRLVAESRPPQLATQLAK